MNIFKQYAVALVAVLLLVGLSFGLIVSFNLIVEDRKYLENELNMLDEKYNQLQQEVTEIETSRQKMVLLMQVYRDGINILNERITTNESEIEDNYDRLVAVDNWIKDEIVLAEQIARSVVVNEVIEEEEIIEEGTEEKIEELVEDPPIIPSAPDVPEIVEEETPVVYACPNRDRSVELNRYIRRLEFEKSTSVVLNYDVIEGQIVNRVFTNGTGDTSRRLYDALERYLIDSAIIIEPEGRDCRLPFRINVE
tara:strand:- start:3842 stop:4597 length:756 start_codon:yes stop_codon:yes gene_type:complete